MQTRSEKSHQRELLNEEWAARSNAPRRSVFRNYSSPTATPGDSANLITNSNKQPGNQADASMPLQQAIDSALARCFVYRFLAQAYQDPAEATWTHIAAGTCHQMLKWSVSTLGCSNVPLADAVSTLCSQLKVELFESFLTAYLSAFGHAARGRCPLNEIEYGDIKADPLFQPHRLADLAAFYRAFGLEVAEDADERHDHICLELEFMCVLAAKEAYALEHQLDHDVLALGRQAQKRFLREHLGRWTPAFCTRLARMAGDTPLGALANFTRAFVAAECARYGITPGSEDLLLRSPDETSERMCDSCGITHLPPGALPAQVGTL